MRQKFRQTVALAVVCCTLGGVWWALSARGNAADSQPPPDGLVVHEWGTFTSFSGSNGARLEFRPLETQDLPGFVEGAFVSLFSKSTLSAIQRLETPVTYFYTPVEMDVEVSVDFPEGLLTEFYPPPRTILPAKVSSRYLPLGAVPEGAKTFGDESSIEVRGGHADWGTVHLIPREQLASQVQDPQLAQRMGKVMETAMVPDAGTNPYGFARATDSAMVQVRHSSTSPVGTPAVEPKAGEDAKELLAAAHFAQRNVLAADYFEKFLFYRGVGQFDLPLSMSSMDGQTMHVRNDSDFELRSLFLVDRDGKQLKFQTIDRLGAHSEVAITWDGQTRHEKDLAASVIDALEDEGLYRKEAESMVRTWQTSWFREEGTRLFYILPQEVTDRLLPLHVKPEPKETVRVMVGRLEFLPPEVEARILKLVEQDLAFVSEYKNPNDAPANPQIREALQELGRFAEPALVRVGQLAKSEPVRKHADDLRRELREKAN